VAQIQAMWAKLNANERLVGYGAIIVLVASLIGIFGGGGVSYGFITAVLILVIYYLKYSGSQINWPAPVATIVLIIAGISAIFAILALLPVLSLGLFFYGGLWFIAYIAGIIGVIVMAYGAWMEYQASAKKV
jgi:hypothetical protein